MSTGRRSQPPSTSGCALKAYRSTSSLNKILQIEPCLLDEYIVSVKSQFGVEYRRFGLLLGAGKPFPTYELFLKNIQDLHQLSPELRKTVHLSYTSKDGDTLPISNDANLWKALEGRPKVLRVVVNKKGESIEERIGYGTPETATTKTKRRGLAISNPHDFRRVSSLMDADILPHELRRVRLCKYQNNKPLGFYIRDGMSERISPWGLVRAPGIFISRLLPNGLAASTNLIHINDEVLEVNGIEVAGKTLDQVTDIMIANSSNLILTLRPAPLFPYHPPYPSFPPPPPYAIPLSPPMYASSPLRAYDNSISLGPPRLPIISTGYGRDYCSPFRPLPPLHAMESFSRASTWRVSDKTTSSSSRSNSSKSRQKRRPVSVHYTLASDVVWPPSPHVSVF